MTKKCTWCDEDLSLVENYVLEDPLFQKLNVYGTKEQQTSNKIVGKTTTKTPICKDCIKKFKKAFEEVKNNKTYNPQKGKEYYKEEHDEEVPEDDLCDLCGERVKDSTFTSLSIKGLQWASNHKICLDCRTEITDKAREKID